MDHLHTAGNEVVEPTIAGTQEQVARGEMLVGSLCSSCHSTNHSLPPTGDTNLLADIPMPLGQSWPPNLTPAGRIDDWTDGELQRAIREGTYPNGHRMPVMSGQTFRNFSQEDLDSIVAFLRTLEPIENNLGKPKTHLSTLAMAMTTLGMLPLNPQPESNVPPPAVPIEPTAAYGEYIASFTDCVVCHGEDFSGGTSAILPHGPDLRIVKTWQPDQFVHAMRTGITPDGRVLSDDMPWLGLGKMHDVELIALYEYLLLLK